MFKSKKLSNTEASPSRPKTALLSALPVGVTVGIAAIVIAAFLVYLPCLNGRFVMDDDMLLTDNLLMRTQDGLYRFCCTTESLEYYPLTYSFFWIEWRLWGTSPCGYHVTSLILHILESLLIWIILRKLSIPGAFLAAVIFAVHPVNVETAAWIAQRKNITAMLFFLLSILWYFKAVQPADIQTAPCHLEDNRRETASGSPHPSSFIPHPSSLIPHPSSYYWLSLAAFVLAMLGKGSAAVLPVLVLVITWWLRPLTRRDLLRTAPFFLIAILLTAVNVWFQTHGGEAITRSADFIQRLLGAGGVVWFYLYKAVLPIDLAFVYRQWHIEAGNPLWWIPLLAALAVTAALWLYRKKTWARPLCCAWAFFCAALVPVMGFTDVGFMKYSLVADHYQHIAIIGVIALATGYWGLWRERMPQKTRWAANLTACAAACLLALLAFQQSAIYRDPVTLYRATLEKNPDCWMAHNNLGQMLFRSGHLQEALKHHNEAIRLKPDYAEAHNNLGVLLAGMGHLPDAVKHYQEAIRLKPAFYEAYYNLGNALANLGRTGDAIEQFEMVLLLKPNFYIAHNNLAAMLIRSGRLQEALEHYEQALRLKPDYAEAHNNLGSLLSGTGHLQDAIEHFRQAINSKTDYPDAYNNMGHALADLGRSGEAIEQFRQALKFKPDFAEAHNNLGLVLVQTEQLPEAIEHFRQAVQFKPDYLEAHINLTLTYANMNQSSQAIAAAQKGLEIARASGQTDEARRIENWLKSYRPGATGIPQTPPASNSADPSR